MHLLPGCRSTFVQRSTGIGSGTINRNRRTAAADGRKFLDSTIGHLISAGTDLAAQDAKGVRHRDIHTDPAHADATIGVIGAAREIWGTAALSGRRSEVGLLRVGMSERREGSKRGRDGEEEGGRHDSAEPLRTRSAWRDRRDCKNPSERCRVEHDEGKRREAEHACLPGLKCALPGTRSKMATTSLAVSQPVESWCGATPTWYRPSVMPSGPPVSALTLAELPDLSSGGIRAADVPPHLSRHAPLGVAHDGAGLEAAHAPVPPRHGRRNPRHQRSHSIVDARFPIRNGPYAGGRVCCG